MSNYKDLEIYRLAYDLAIKVHQMSLKLPSYELYEQGSQVRRSTKSIKDAIAELSLKLLLDESQVDALIHDLTRCRRVKKKMIDSSF